MVSGTLHTHVVYEKAGHAAAHPGRWFVFLEGDGSPWGNSGMQPATDPTTRNPLALRLMLATDDAAIYVVRPCYQGHNDARCSTDRWTSGRYSDEVVASMAAAIESESKKLRANHLIVVGYSGGGALAVLVAERLQDVAAVITIGANLDIAAWAEHHHYLPLSQSLNPALSDRAHPWAEFHFNGANDAVVPIATTDDYFKRYPGARRVVVDSANHTCCWEADWPALLAALPLTSQSE
jgi:pimeloyl-ACP methyl ester carboxylesterase